MIAPDQPDPFLWLEDVDGTSAKEWVRAHNATTLAALEDEGFAHDQAALAEMLAAPDKIPFVVQRGRHLFSFWQDGSHPRGLWRRTTMESYRSSQPQWEVLLDLDALASAEGENWVWKGTATLPRSFSRALIKLSRGGADASVVREFDLRTLSFVEGGFVLPEAKTDVDWLDENTLLVTSPLGSGHATSSGYGRTVRRWRRGQPFDAAETIFAGQDSDVSVWTNVDHESGFEHTILGRQIAFFDSEAFLLRPDDQLDRIDVPTDADRSLHRDWMTLELRSPWTVGDRQYEAGSLLAISFAAFMSGSREFDVLFAPGERRVLRGIAWSRSRLAINVLDNLCTEVQFAEPSTQGWRITPLTGLPETETTDIWCLGQDEEGSVDAFMIGSTGYLTPMSLSLVTADRGRELLKQAPARFDANGLVVTRHEAVAADRVRIPYFQVSRADLPLDGSNPTVLYGYGGFLVGLLPGYVPHFGKTWLARGGVYVVANIRGGDEFGPGWHRDGIREHKRRAQDDFAAVAADLIARKVTSPSRLACHGGSNGGLLTGNMLTRHPELFGAVWCTIPLLDMRRYTKLLAGASWIAEYGDPESPDDWPFLREISPYHLASADKPYPPILLWTSARDDRVHPGHARKMAARLEELGQPVFFYEPAEGGHGTADFRQTAHMWALGFSFLRRTIGRDHAVATGGDADARSLKAP